LGGLLLTLFPLALAAVGLASLNVPALGLAIAVGSFVIPLSAASATVSLLVARKAEARALAESNDGLLGSPAGRLTDAKQETEIF
jgi:hypothetical protein